MNNLHMNSLNNFMHCRNFSASWSPVLLGSFSLSAAADLGNLKVF